MKKRTKIQIGLLTLMVTLGSFVLTPKTAKADELPPGTWYQTMAHCTIWSLKLACTTEQTADPCRKYYCYYDPEPQ